MFKYIDICVDMKQGRKCKDALINYRNACQQVNVGSLEDVIKYLLQVASQRAEEASKAAEAKLDAVEDLEAEASPEEMMLSYVSGEKSKDRTDRELVTPWFKFLWETYRCVACVGDDVGGREAGLQVRTCTLGGGSAIEELTFRR
jgi:translation initiation factor 3 subunit A